MKTIVCASLLSLTTAAAADVQISSFSFGPGAVPFGASGELDLFDDNGGLHVLKSIEFTFTVSMRADVVVHANAGPQVITVGVSGNTQASDGLLFNIAGGIFTTESSPELNEGDLWNFGTIEGVFAGSSLINNPVFFALYTGAGTFTVNATGTGIFGFVGGGNAELFITNFEAEGTVGVIYTYNVIPAPGALAVLGALGLLCRRRRA